MTVTDGGQNDEDDTTNGMIKVTVPAGKTYGAATDGTIVVKDGDDPAGQQDSATYVTENYDVDVTKNVTQGSTQQIEGDIYEYPGDRVDQTMEYTLNFDPQLNQVNNGDTTNYTVLTDSDTSNGHFVTTRTFDETNMTASGATDYDFPRDGTSVGDNADPGYVVYVAEDGTQPTDATNSGSDVINTRLNVEGGTDPSSPTYKDTIDVVNGMISNADGGLGSYQIQFKDPSGTTAKTTKSASTGEFSFTAVVNDAGTWNIGTSVGPFIPYKPIDVAPQQADFNFTAPNGQVKNFQTDYKFVVKDNRTGAALDLSKMDPATGDTQYEGYINVTGEFNSVEGTLTGNSGSEAGVVGSSGNVIAAVDSDDDDNIEYFHVTTDADGTVMAQATPVGNQVTATLENNDVSSKTAPGVENEDDAADTAASPDYAATETIDSKLRGPVNILRDQVIDMSSGTNIYEDAGPAVIEVLPQHDGDIASRIINGYRVGYDENQNLAGMTSYQIQFELYNSTNEFIYPAQSTDTWDTTDPGMTHELDWIKVNGLEANATLQNSGGDGLAESKIGSEGVVQFGAVYDADADVRDEYVIGIKPQESVDINEKLNVTIKVHGADPVTYKVDATGLNISKFEIDGETVTSVQAGTTPNLTSILSAPYDGGVPVNNGRVRLAKISSLGQTDLNETDARTQNIQNGEYTFTNVQVGDRGVDTAKDNDGIAEGTADLAFTGYQYVDADGDQALEQFEVDRGAYEELDIAARPMNIIFDPANTSKYSGHRTNAFGQPAFTLTEGVEYERIAFHLEYPNGTAVDLTDGFENRNVGLNELAQATTNGGQPFVQITGPVQVSSPSNARVLFNESASNASAGYYVIDDVAREYWIHTDESNGAQDLNEDGSFSFSEGDNPSDRNQNTYRLKIIHPTRSFSSMENASTGYFSTFPPKIDTNIVGVNTSENGAPDHVMGDNFKSVSNVENVTTDIGRWYRVEGQLTDYFGTPVNGTEYDETYIQEDFSVDADNGNVVFLGTMGNSQSGTGLELNNESGRFMFDIHPMSSDSTGFFDTDYLTHVLKTDGTDANWATQYSPPFPYPTTHVTAGPTGTRPRVQVYDQSGAKLPRADDTGNLLLANDVKQTLRIEAFPSDPDDLPLPRRTFTINTSINPVQENTISTTTNLKGSSVLVTDNDDYLNIPYEMGQVGYFTLTPTGTGDAVIQLRDDDNNVVRNVNGAKIVFDTNRANKEAALSLSTNSVTPGGDLVVTVTAAATNEPIGRAGVALSDTNGNVISTVTTNGSGMATITVPASAELGEYTLETRPAGYQPVTKSFSVRTPAQLDEDLTLFPQKGQVISGTSSAEAGTNYTIQINGPGVIDSAVATVQDDGTFSATFNLSALSPGDKVTAEIAGVDKVTYTIQEPPTATVDIRNQVSSSGDIVNVREAYLPRGGYIVIHNASTGNVIGHTAYFEPGTYDDVDVLLDQKLKSGSNKVVAMAHLDTNGNQKYEFPDADGPYTANGSPVTDTASVAVPEGVGPTPTPTDTPTTTTTTAPPTTTTTTTEQPADTTTTSKDTGGGDGPGFGIGIALIALLGAALLAARRNE